MSKKYLVTSALPYINGVKHLGNLIGSILPADVYTRFLKQQGNEVVYICGTDEHGTPAEIAANDAGMSVESYCEKMYNVQKEIYEKFDINFDFFGRTSSKSNHELTVEIFKKLYENGYIEEQYINQYYSIDDERFLPDRYVEGICPHCKYERARGDQCDGCGVLLNPEDLIEPYSSISKSKNIVLQKTAHFFLNMPKLEGQVAKWIEKQSIWSDIVKGIAKKWLSDGLRPRCITRDLKWGIKVPSDWIKEQKKKNGSELTGLDIDNKVFYVWFDAPNGYISITKDWAESIGSDDAWKDLWLPKNEDDVFYVEFMAKDNVPFHAVFWPSMLLGTGINFKKVDDIKGFHWLTYNQGKFSTSQGRGVFTDTALDLYPADYWRYYLLANCPESSDSDFTFESFAMTVNKDLADILGNFTSRSIALLKKYFDMNIVELNEENIDKDLEIKVKESVVNITNALMNRKFRLATSELRSLWAIGNEYITQKEPWHVLKSDKSYGGVILSHCFHLLRIFAIASFPFIPATSRKIFEILNENAAELDNLMPSENVNFLKFKNGHKINDSGILFSKIDNEIVSELTERFSGN